MSEINMEKELQAKETIRDAISPYGPREVETKLAFKLGEKRLELHGAAAKIINADNKDLTIFYPASGPDVANVLPSTHATKIILADKDQHTSNIIKEIKDIGGSIQKVSYSGNKSEIDFEWEGKSRKVIFYHLEIDKNSIDKLMGEVGHYDVYFEKKSQDLGSPEILEKFMGNLKNGGYAVLDYDADNHIGLEKEPLDKKYDGEDYWYGHHRMKIYRKQRNVRGMGLRLNLNRTLSDAEYTRNGGYIGIDEKAYEPTFKVYRQQLMELKNVFDAIQAESKEELQEKVSIKAEIIERLYKAKGDMSMVLDSPENLQKQLKHLIQMRAISAESHEIFAERIREAYNSPDRPTEQQLEKFIEDGRKIFREVFIDWVV